MKRIERPYQNESSHLSYRYTTDGSDPTLDSKLYESPFALHKPGKIRAKAFLSDSVTSSEIITAYF